MPEAPTLNKRRSGIEIWAFFRMTQRSTHGKQLKPSPWKDLFPWGEATASKTSSAYLVSIPRSGGSENLTQPGSKLKHRPDKLRVRARAMAVAKTSFGCEVSFNYFNTSHEMIFLVPSCCFSTVQTILPVVSLSSGHMAVAVMVYKMPVISLTSPVTPATTQA